MTKSFTALAIFNICVANNRCRNGRSYEIPRYFSCRLSKYSLLPFLTFFVSTSPDVGMADPMCLMFVCLPVVFVSMFASYISIFVSMFASCYGFSYLLSVQAKAMQNKRVSKSIKASLIALCIAKRVNSYWIIARSYV